MFLVDRHVPRRVGSGRKFAKFHLLVALALSVLLHGVLLTKSGLFSGGRQATLRPELRVTLIASPEMSVAANDPPPASAPPAPAITREAAVVKRVMPKRVSPPTPEKMTGPAVAVPPAAVTPSAEQKAEQKSGIPFGISAPVRWVNLEFETFLGADRQSAGSGQHRFASDDSGRYSLSVAAVTPETGGVEARSWRLDIAGNIRKNNLFPTLFKMQGSLPERFLSLAESPDVGNAAPGAVREGRMPDSILDRQSLLYRFMLSPPSPTGGSLMLTDGTRYTTFSYRIAGIESFSVAPYGVVRAVKVVLSASDSAEIIELWLLSDLHYLPVKVRHVDRRGVITEQLVRSLDFK